MPLTFKRRLAALQSHSLLSSAAILFISANIANMANLGFNMIFARLMGPALFADLTVLLTLKLAVLSFLSAVQFAFAEYVAKASHARESEHQAQYHAQSQAQYQAKTLSWKGLKLAIPIMFIIMAAAEYFASSLNLSSPLALCLLALAIPFFVPMVIYRGLTQGLIDVPRIVASIQAEWVIRLMGSLLMWKMGFGLAGIAAAIALSIIAGFIFSTAWPRLNITRKISEPASPPIETIKPTKVLGVKTLGITAMPYFILQAAQVLVLDSDIFIAKAIFPAQIAGLVAGLLLIQRVFFFAFLSCSAIIQPYVARQTDTQKILKDLFTLLSAISVITALALAVIIPNSALVVKIMLGDAYMQLSPIIWISALTGAMFIISHLCAISLIAKGQKLAAIWVLSFGILQFISLMSVNHLFPDIGLYSYFSLKLAIQCLCAMCLLGVVMRAHKVP